MADDETALPLHAVGSFWNRRSSARAASDPYMNAAVSVVPARLEDEATAVALFQAQLEEHDIVTPARALQEVTRAVLADNRHGFILLARAQDELVGIAYAAAHLSAEHGGIIGWLEELYVRPAWRARRVGSALLDDVAKRAKQLGWRGLELEVVAGHERAVPLYLCHDFLPVSRARFSRIFTPHG